MAPNSHNRLAHFARAPLGSNALHILREGRSAILNGLGSLSLLADARFVKRKRETTDGQELIIMWGD
jgi:hypothetical protein